MHRILEQRLQPPVLPAPVVLSITMVFAGLTIVRGLDWLLIRKPGTISTLMLDNVLGLAFWGGILVAGAAGLIFTYALRRHFPVWCAHSFLVCVYFGIAITTAQGVVEYGGGMQNLVAPVGAMVWHATLSREMRPLPRRPGGRDAR